MIEFAIIGAPRSGTAWFAAVITALGGTCRHEPTRFSTVEEMSEEDESFGIADTGLFLYPEIVNSLNCPVIVIERDHNDIQKSLNTLGMGLPPGCLDQLQRIEGRRIKFHDLFNDFEKFFRCAEILVSASKPYAREVWEIFREMNIQNTEAIRHTQNFMASIQYAEHMSAGLH